MRSSLIVNSLIVSVLAFSSISCATLFQGTNEEIAITSHPSGAAATISDGRSGLTPFSIHTKRSEDIQVHFSKPGYQAYDVSDVSHAQWGYVVSDIFFTGLIGLGVDGMDGAMFYHSQQMVSAHLEPLPVQSASATEGVALTPSPVLPVVSSAVVPSQGSRSTQETVRSAAVSSPSTAIVAAPQQPASPAIRN